MKKKFNIFVSTVLVFDVGAQKVNYEIYNLSKILKSHYANYEIVIVDDGIPNDELRALEELLITVPCLRIIRLSRVCDTDTAIFAGVESSIGDIVCILYQNDPVELVPTFVNKVYEDKKDIAFGIAKNRKRMNVIESKGSQLFYWYSRRYMNIDVPTTATYFIAMNRAAANALTRSGRYMRHIRHIAKQVGFTSENIEYELPRGKEVYDKTKTSTVLTKALDLAANYSSHPLRAVTYFGLFAGFLNILYACYVVIVNLSHSNIEKGWTTLSLQSSAMFFVLFMILAILAEYIGKILSQTQQEPPYHIMQELSSKVSIADATRRNVTD